MLTLNHLSLKFKLKQFLPKCYSKTSKSYEFFIYEETKQPSLSKTTEFQGGNDLSDQVQWFSNYAPEHLKSRVKFPEALDYNCLIHTHLF